MGGGGGGVSLSRNVHEHVLKACACAYIDQKLIPALFTGVSYVKASLVKVSKYLIDIALGTHV